jgi:hypothetical protein
MSDAFGMLQKPYTAMPREGLSRGHYEDRPSFVKKYLTKVSLSKSHYDQPDTGGFTERATVTRAV